MADPETHEAIRRLMAIYAQLLDSKRIAEWGQLFAEDAVFEAGGVVYEACSKCHAAYLIPLAPPGGKPK